MIFHRPSEQCCPFDSLTTSVTISGCLIHLFTFKFPKDIELCAGKVWHLLQLVSAFQFPSLLSFFLLFRLKALKTPYSKYPIFLPEVFPCQAHSLSLKHLPEPPDGCSIQMLASGLWLHPPKSLNDAQPLALPEFKCLSPGCQSCSAEHSLYFFFHENNMLFKLWPVPDLAGALQRGFC